jgi:hypothetical protein
MTTSSVSAWGGICSILAVMTLVWFLPRWWRGRSGVTLSVLSVAAVFAAGYEWLMNLALLISN